MLSKVRLPQERHSSCHNAWHACSFTRPYTTRQWAASLCAQGSLVKFSHKIGFLVLQCQRGLGSSHEGRSSAPNEISSDTWKRKRAAKDCLSGTEQHAVPPTYWELLTLPLHIYCQCEPWAETSPSRGSIYLMHALPSLNTAVKGQRI